MYITRTQNRADVRKFLGVKTSQTWIDCANFKSYKENAGSMVPVWQVCGAIFVFSIIVFSIFVFSIFVFSFVFDFCSAHKRERGHFGVHVAGRCACSYS
jgi:hypothetical protein